MLYHQRRTHKSNLRRCHCASLCKRWRTALARAFASRARTFAETFAARILAPASSSAALLQLMMQQHTRDNTTVSTQASARFTSRRMDEHTHVPMAAALAIGGCRIAFATAAALVVSGVLVTGFMPRPTPSGGALVTDVEPAAPTADGALTAPGRSGFAASAGGATLVIGGSDAPVGAVSGAELNAGIATAAISNKRVSRLLAQSRTIELHIDTDTINTQDNIQLMSSSSPESSPP